MPRKFPCVVCSENCKDNCIYCEVSPAFLHGNSTSHTWPFSAIAELIDNAYDPDVNASELWIDQRKIGGFDECLSFVDNGNGMTEDKLYKMLSFGYCEKVPIGGVKPIGYYGNGFKSGSMRLGKDALVFTRCLTSTSIGFLSQTYLRAINADAVLVPIVTWQLPSMQRLQTPESNANLQAILTYSAINKEEDLFNELKSLENMKTGTRIIIYNLRKDKSDKYELDFTSDKLDIRNPETHVVDLTTINRPIHTSSPEHRRSLREYCSILYLKPRMKIVLRGQKVVTKLISKSLSQTEIDVYKPTWLPRPIKLTFGFTDNQEPESYGLMMYHKNRLVRAYEKIGCQNKANGHGVGVVGVVEANFLEPIHNKQDFNRTDKYSAFMQNTAMKLNDYFFEKTQSENPEAAPAMNMSQLPDWTWAQCDNCLSWRRLPTGYQEKLPEKWFCRMNPDAAFNRCDIPEEPEDDDEALQPTYRKTYKKKEEEKKRQARLAEERKIKEREALLQQKEQIIQKNWKEMRRQNEQLSQVSSSQDRVDRKPTVRDLELAHVNLQRSQLRLAEQEKIIKRLEQQKRENEENKKAMLQLAESMKLKSAEGKKLAEKVQDMQGTSSSTVTSSSTTLRAPIKRKASDSSGPGGKVVKIKTEDGGSISITPGVIDLTFDSDEEESEENATSGKSPKQTVKSKSGSDENVEKDNTKTKSVEKDNTETKSVDKDNTETTTKSTNKQTAHGSETESAGSSGKSKTTDSVEDASDPSIDNTNHSEEDEKATESTTESDKSDSAKRDSAKKDSEKDAQTNSTQDKEKSDAKEKSDTSQSQADNYTEMEDVKPVKEELDKQIFEAKKTCLAHRGSQTVPTVIKFASPEEVDLEKLSQLEQKHMLLQKARELDESKKSLHSLQENIWQLLKIIVPDFDYGNPENIENIILDFIRVNGEKS